MKNKRKILKYFLHNRMILDLISIFPFINRLFFKHLELINTEYNFLIDLLFLFRVYHFNEISKKFGNFLFLDVNFQCYYLLIKLLFRILFLSHIFACLWHFIGNIQLEQKNTWMHYKEIEFEDFYTKYLYSFYFVSVTMNTVGYGDITPQNKLEFLYSIFFIFSACIIFAFTINSIGNFY